MYTNAPVFLFLEEKFQLDNYQIECFPTHHLLGFEDRMKWSTSYGLLLNIAYTVGLPLTESLNQAVKFLGLSSNFMDETACAKEDIIVPG